MVSLLKTLVQDLMIKTIISAESNMSSLFQQNVGSRYYLAPVCAWPNTSIPRTNHMTRHYDYSGLQVLLLWVVRIWHPPWLPLEALANRGQHLPQSSQVTSNTLSSSSFSFLTSVVHFSMLITLSSSSLDLDVKSPLATEVFNMARYHIPNKWGLKIMTSCFWFQRLFLAQGWDWRSKRKLLNRWATRIWQGEITWFLTN